jgi:hypothetical protein
MRASTLTAELEHCRALATELTDPAELSVLSSLADAFESLSRERVSEQQPISLDLAA